MKKIFVAFIFLLLTQFSFAQRGKQLLGGILSGGSGMSSNSGNPADTSGKMGEMGFEHRDDAKDSISISYKYLDSIRSNRLDSTLNDFGKYFPINTYQQFLGNNGSAAYSLIYSPNMKAGWDAGFHAFDIYRYTLENTKFYKTTKPFTQLSYELATGKEQMIKILHTQNPFKQLNVGFEYRLISAPGFFITQNTNHNNYRIFSNYQGKRKRYAAYFTLFSNSLRSSENGGIANDSFLTNPDYKRRFTVPVNLGGDAAYTPNPFKTSVSTGNIYKDFTFFLRQSYDIGKNDSLIINDSTTEYLFYSKLRFQHTFSYSTSSYEFKDVNADSAIYHLWYDTTLKKAIDTLIVIDKWKILSNDFSLLQFPDTKNLSQYILAGAKLENITGTFAGSSKNLHNIILHGEYVNKTRNRLWDILAKGEFYLNGYNSGDYSAYANLTRFFNKKWGNVRLTFQNVNRSTSFIYSGYSSFNFGNKVNYNKENITMMKATADNPFISLSATNYLITNLIYFNNYYQTDQYSKVINLLQLSASKKFRFGKRWNWYTEAILQQTDAAAPVKVPFIFTRNRIVYEGVFYKNLNLSTGIEVRYYTPFKSYNYSPVMGQFTPQDSVKISNMPDISAFFHFRIKSFTGFLRAENLNTISFSNGFGFTNNNFAAPHYAYPGFIFRFGIQWNFVN